MKLTRRRLLEGALATTLGVVGSDRLGERFAHASGRRAPARPREQHVLGRNRVVVDDGVEVVVPSLHHRVVTARVKIGEGRAALGDARHAFGRALDELERSRPDVSVVVAWGLPYLRRFVHAQARRELPVDRRASAARGRRLRVLEDTERFPSDPEDTILEHNDLAVLMRSDHVEGLDEAERRLFAELPEVFAVTSIRRGFVGGGFGGAHSLPKRMLTAARIRGADLMPASAQLYLGFTSTVKRALGPPKIVNFETLGYASLPSGYFVGGTHMHLSHIDENVLAWYLDFDHRERVHAMFRPGLEVPPARQTVRQAAADAATTAQIRRDYARFKRIGHAGAIQAASRLDRDTVAHDGTVYRKGTAVPQRADFNTLDNPFAWSADPVRDRLDHRPTAGVHFVVFNPTSDDFRRIRLAMDAILPNGSRLKFEARSIGQGLNSVLRTTHRQNFLVPPRAHRSFPLSELRG